MSGGTTSPRQDRHMESRLSMVHQGTLTILIGEYPNEDKPIIEIQVRGLSMKTDLSKQVIEAIKPILSDVAKSEGCRLSTKVR